MRKKLTAAQIDAQEYREFRKFVANLGGTYETRRSIDSGQPYHLIHLYVDLPGQSYSLNKQGDWGATKLLLEDLIRESQLAA